MAIKLSAAQRDLLTANANPSPWGAPVTRGSTFQALRRRGLVQSDGTVTDAGREAIGLLPAAIADAVAQINAIDVGDPERAHQQADDILLSLVHDEVRRAGRPIEVVGSGMSDVDDIFAQLQYWIDAEIELGQDQRDGAPEVLAAVLDEQAKLWSEIGTAAEAEGFPEWSVRAASMQADHLRARAHRLCAAHERERRRRRCTAAADCPVHPTASGIHSPDYSE